MNRRWISVFGALAASAVVVGAYARFKGLGVWPLTTDEYFTAKSIGYILQGGAPSFPCGGYYDRGLLLQYLIAPVVLFLGNTEWALRLLPVLFNLATLPALYMLAKRVSGIGVACVVVVLFSLSLWEIEVARYVRMYSAFQAVFAWYIYFMYRAVVEGDSGALNRAYALSVVSIFIYEGAAFLVLMNFLPFVMDRAARPSKAHFAVAFFGLMGFLAYFRVDFRHFGVSDYLPDDVKINAGGGIGLPVSLPRFLLETIPPLSVWMAMFLLLAALTGFLVYRLASSRDIAPRTRFALGTLGVLTLFNQFGLALYCVALFLLLGWVALSARRLRMVSWLGGLTVLNLVYWTAYVTVTGYWHSLFAPGVDLSLRKAFVVMLKYPNVFDPLVYQYMVAMPVFSITAALLMGVVFLYAVMRLGPCWEQARFLLVVLAIVTGIVGIVKTNYNATLYTFFAYPLVLLLAAAGLYIIAQWTTRSMQGIIMVTALAIFIGLSEDYRVDHLMHVDSQEFNYRMVYTRAFRDHLLYREDYRTPAEVVNRARQPGDIVVSTMHVPERYLDKLDYIYISAQSPGFDVAAGCGGERELFTNSALIYRKDALLAQLTEAASTAWLIMPSPEFERLSQEEIELVSRFGDALFYTGVDGTISVYRIENKTKNSPEVS